MGFRLLGLWVFALIPLFSVEPEPKPLSEIVVETSGQLKKGESVIDYRVQAGTLVMKDEQGKEKGSIFYMGYFRKGVPLGNRPITFCFNGGPGAGSVWLNIGLAGPKKVAGNDLSFLAPPFSLEDNSDSLIDETDLVFIDPISTGLSVLALGQDGKCAFGVEEDHALMAQFIQQLTVKLKRWDSPKYIMGESYGGLRAVLVAERLHEEGYYFNGLFLISPVLDMQTLIANGGNDLPYVLSLPVFAQVAQYHQKASLKATAQELEQFAGGEYAAALFAGDLLSPEAKEKMAEELGRRIGLSKELILQQNLRVSPMKFRKALLADQNLLVGRFDGRMTGVPLQSGEGGGDYDPSLEAVFGAMTGALNQYIDKELKWPEVRDYKPLVSLPSWNWGKGNQYANGLVELKRLMVMNPQLKLVIAAGEFDLAAPPFSTRYSIDHAFLPEAVRERIQWIRYPAGHMFYFNKKYLIDFNYNIKIKLR